MRPVDVVTEVEIGRPVAAVAAFAADPGNAPAWYANIEAVEWRTAPPLRVGSVIAFRARFLGRRLAYDYEIVEHVPDVRFVMRTSDGPFPMETTYSWRQLPDDRTHMTLRNRGAPSGFSALGSALVVPAMRRANRGDLARLKSILEAANDPEEDR